MTSNSESPVGHFHWVHLSPLILLPLAFIPPPRSGYNLYFSILAWLMQIISCKTKAPVAKTKAPVTMNRVYWKREDQKRKSKRTEDTDARKGRKVAKHCVFPMICGSGGSKSRLAKAAGADPAGHRSDEKLHAVVARSTFPSQNVQNTSASDHFWKLRCRKSARRCGAKHISKSKCTKHLSFGPLLEVEMSKKCTPLWREAHFQVKSVKN